MSADLFDIPENVEGISNEVQEQIEIMDNLILSCFNTRAGKKVMAHMKDIAMQPGFDANMGLFNGIANGFSREGQVALVQYLKRRMIRAERVK